MKNTKCGQCGGDFEIYGEDLIFYKKFDVPEPRQCPNCRLIRRLLERNSKHLYYRKCDAAGENILSQYHENQPFPVYSPKIWWDDQFDAVEYGRGFDFNKSFFEQYKNLKNETPHLALFNTEGTMQNSDFNNCTAYIKNCYLIAESDYCEDCYYSNLLKKSTNLVDCSICYECELCYECNDCANCYGLRYSADCANCKDSYFLQNCISCNDCIGCINQRHKQYMILNKQYSKEEYEKRKKELQLDTQNGIEAGKKICGDFFLSQPHKTVFAEHNQNSIGDHLFDSKNAFYCFESRDLEDCRYCAKLSLGVKTSMDYSSWGNKSELMYQCGGTGDHCYNCKFCVMCHTNMRNCDYCYECFSCNDCFGCVGLKKKKHCILNKQYSETNYRSLKERIIKYMRQTGEYGEFFPVYIGAFAYNESIAMDIFPLSKEQAVSKRYKWLDEPEKTPLKQKDNSQNKEIFQCDCGKNYKIIAQEAEFYKQINLPSPAKCPSCRHKSRMAKRNPLKLWQRPCAKCGAGMQSTYAPERPEIVYCEDCYLKTVY